MIFRIPARAASQGGVVWQKSYHPAGCRSAVQAVFFPEIGPGGPKKCPNQKIKKIVLSQTHFKETVFFNFCHSGTFPGPRADFRPKNGWPAPSRVVGFLPQIPPLEAARAATRKIEKIALFRIHFKETVFFDFFDSGTFWGPQCQFQAKKSHFSGFPTLAEEVGFTNFGWLASIGHSAPETWPIWAFLSSLGFAKGVSFTLCARFARWGPLRCGLAGLKKKFKIGLR